MLNKNKVLKNILVLFLATALMIVSNYFLISLFTFFGGKTKISNAINTIETVTISNGNFTLTSSGSTYPKTPTGWTTNTETIPEIVKGVIDVHPDTYNANKSLYKLSSNPGSSPTSEDTSILMLNNTSDKAYSAYYTSSTISLSANSYYVINVYGKTQNNATLGIYLSDSAGKIDLGFECQYQTWANAFSFCIATSQFESSTVSITLYLGKKTSPSKGAVFFDNISCQKVSEGIYNTYNESNEKVKKVSLKEDAFLTNVISNPSFETEPLNWGVNKSAGATASLVSKNIVFDNIETPYTHNEVSSGNDSVLYLNAGSNGYATVTSSSFVVKQYELIKLSVWLKTNTTNTNITLNVINYLKNNVNTGIETSLPSSSSSTIKTTGTGNTTDGWEQHSFYITGHPNYDTTLQLVLGVGKVDFKTTGYAFFDDVTFERITYTQFQNGSTGTNATKFSLYTFADATVKNGYFNLLKNVTYKEDGSVKAPLTPENWSFVTNSSTIRESDYSAGVIDTRTVGFDTSLGVANPGKTPLQELTMFDNNNLTTNNVLMINNLNSTNTGFKSSTVSLSENSYFKISVTFKTTGVSKANIYLTSNNFIIAKANNLTSTGNWSVYNFYIKTSAFNAETAIELWNGYKNNNSTGAVFFDNITFASIASEVFSGASTLPYTRNNVVDLNVENFDTVDETENSNLLKTTAFNSELKQSVSENASSLISAGVVDTTSLNETFPSISDVGYVNGKNVLLIHAMDEVHYNFTTNNSYSLNSGSYYKLSVYSRVKSINGAKDADADYIGASIKLSSFDDYFYGIKQTLSNWSVYTFYIQADSSVSVNLILSLGNEKALSRGYALFDNITFEKLDKTTFESAYNLSLATNENVIKLKTTSATENESAVEQNEDSSTEFNWLWIPSIALGLALLIAVIGVTAKHINFKALVKPKKIKVDYDKEAIAKKEQKVKKAQERKKKFIELITTPDEDEQDEK